MLRPYLTVIKDSFRAAMSARVLYVVLLLIVVVLAVLAPFHVRQTLDWRLSFERGFPAPDRLVKRLVEEGKSGDRAAVAHVWNQLSPDLQEDLVEEAKKDPDNIERPDGPGGTPVQRRLLSEFNVLMEEGDLYDEVAFAGKRLGDEAGALIDKGTGRTLAEDRRLNRLLLSTALRRDVATPSDTQLDFYYFNWHWTAFTTNISHSEFASGIASQLPTYFDKFIMSIGIFIAILITASIIPEMLEPGSLNLLLSKPVHRWGLLLAKYAGGCVFILLFATLLFVGLWLWMGIQLGIWERAILLSIPTYVFVFAMYYAISVLAGIWFRSPILCITFAVLFWAVCWAIGTAYAWLDYRHYNASARQIVAAGDDVMMVDLLQQHLAWDPIKNEWRNPSNREMTPEEGGFVFASFMDRLDAFPDMPGPAFDGSEDKFVFVDSGITEALSNAKLKLTSANPKERWTLASRGGLPSSTVQLLYSEKQGQLAVDQTGSIFRWKGKEQAMRPAPSKNGDKDKKKDENDKATKKISDQISGLLGGNRDRIQYEEITEDTRFYLLNPDAVCLNPTTDDVFLYSGGNLFAMTPAEDGKYAERAEQPVGDHDNERMTAFVGSGGDNVFVMLGNGRFFHINAADLSPINSVDLSQRTAIRSLSVSQDGRFAALTLRGGELWIYDANEKTTYSGFSISHHDVMACTFDEQGRLWIGDRFSAAYCYDLSSGKEIIGREPESGWVTRGFRMVIRPLYRIFPKPGEFYKLVSHLSSSGDARENPDIDLTKLPHRDDPWAPLKSGVVFTLLVLALACFVFQRQDF